MYEVFVHCDEVGWQPAKFPGVSLKILHENSGTGELFVLRKLTPHAVIPKHFHSKAHEFVYILEGDFIEDGKPFGPGQVFFGKAGVAHGPHTTVGGCVVLTHFSAELDVQPVSEE